MPVPPFRFPRGSAARLAVLCLCLLIAPITAVAEVPAERLLGGIEGLWLVGPGEKPGTTAIHAGPFPGPPGPAQTPRVPLLRSPADLSGRVTHAAAVDGGRSLWIVLEGGGVTRLLAGRGDPARRRSAAVSFMPALDLPNGHRPLAVAAAGEALWVVAERDVAGGEAGGDAGGAAGGAAGGDAGPDAESAGDGEPASAAGDAADDRSRALKLRLRGGAGSLPAKQPSGGGLADAGDDPVVLLGLVRGDWERHRLPAAALGAAGAEAGWALIPGEAGRPGVLLRTSDGGLHLFEPGPGSGGSGLDLGEAPPLAAPPVEVAGVQVLLLAAEEDPTGLSAEALRPRSDNPRVELLPVGETLPGSAGTLGFLAAAGRLWSATPSDAPEPGEAAAEGFPAWARDALEAPIDRWLRLTPVGLDGAEGPARPLGVTRLGSAAGVADFPLLLLMLMVATAATFVFWRRDPRRLKLRLKKDQRLAEFGPRMAAGAIDAGPGLLLAWALMGAGPGEVFTHWPGLGRPGTILEVLPALLLVAVTVLHTGVSEALTGRSLGKALLGLRVTDLGGRPPKPGRVVVRTLMKPVDLIAVFLLVLPLINPHRQRLADLVAGTVVVAARPRSAE